MRANGRRPTYDNQETKQRPAAPETHLEKKPLPSASDSQMTGTEFVQLLKYGVKQFKKISIIGVLDLSRLGFSDLELEEVDFTQAMIFDGISQLKNTTARRIKLTREQMRHILMAPSDIKFQEAHIVGGTLDIDEVENLRRLGVSVFENVTVTAIHRLTKPERRTTMFKTLALQHSDRAKLKKERVGFSVSDCTLTPEELTGLHTKLHVQSFNHVTIMPPPVAEHSEKVTAAEFEWHIKCGGKSSYEGCTITGDVDLCGVYLDRARLEKTVFEKGIAIDRDTDLRGCIGGVDWDDYMPIKYYVNDSDFIGIDVDTLYKKLEKKYDDIRRKEFFSQWTFTRNRKSDFFSKLNCPQVERKTGKRQYKKTGQKLFEVLQHAKRNTSSRTHKALQAVLTELHDDKFVMPERVVLPRSKKISVDPQTRSDSVTPLLDAPTRPPTPKPAEPLDLPAVFETMRDYFDDRGVLKVEKVVNDKSAFQRMASSYVQNEEVLEEWVTAEIENSTRILDQALLNVDNFNLKGEVLKLERGRQMFVDKVDAAYLFLRHIQGEESVVRYHELLKKIYPKYLRLGMSGKEYYNDPFGQKKMRCNWVSLLFVDSGIDPDAQRLHLLSQAPCQIVVEPGFFRRFSDDVVETFEDCCFARWAKIPLEDLAKAGFVEPDMLSAVNTNMCDVKLEGEERTCLEKQYYIAHLFKAEKFELAYQESKAFKKAWPKAREDTFWSELRNLTQNAIKEVVSCGALGGECYERLRTFNKFSAANHESIRDLDVGIEVQASQARGMETWLAESALFTKILKQIAEGLLVENVDPVLFVTLNQCAETTKVCAGMNFIDRRGKSFVWVGDQKSQEDICIRLRSKTRRCVSSPPTYHDEVLEALCTLILNMKRADQYDYFREPVTVKFADLKKFNHAVYHVESAVETLEKVLQEALTYSALKEEIFTDVSGRRRLKCFDVKALSPSLIDNPTWNSFKYQLLLDLQKKIDESICALNACDGQREGVESILADVLCCIVDIDKKIPEAARYSMTGGLTKFYALMRNEGPVFQLAKEWIDAWSTLVPASPTTAARAVEHSAFGCT